MRVEIQRAARAERPDRWRVALWVGFGGEDGEREFEVLDEALLVPTAKEARRRARMARRTGSPFDVEEILRELRRSS